MFKSDKHLKDFVDGQTPELATLHAKNTGRLEYLAHQVYSHQTLLIDSEPEEVKRMTGQDMDVVVEVYRQHLATYYEFCKMFAPHKDPNKLYQCFAHHFGDYRYEFESPDYSIDTGQPINEVDNYQGPPQEKYTGNRDGYNLKLLDSLFDKAPGE